MPDLQKYYDFVEYVKTTDNIYSYKFVLLQSVIKNADQHGRASLQAVADDFRSFYKERLKNGLPVERQGAAIHRVDSMSNNELRRLILENPYRSIKRGEWLNHEKDTIQIDPELWSLFTVPDKLDLLNIIHERICDYFDAKTPMEAVAERHGAALPINEQLKHIHSYILAKGFQFSYEDLANFFLCLRTKPFVILAGVSGTGKSQLPRLFSEAINAHWRNIPVRPDWNDGSDLLGYVDLEGNFRPGALISVIEQCNAAPATPHIVVLDEMNLARVEHYLADVLSIMETREHVFAGIQTNPLLENATFPRETDRELYGSLSLPDNLYLVGTVNMDETTHPFSKKVLDRANTIEFSHIDLASYRARPVQLGEVMVLSNSQLGGRYLRLVDIASSQIVDRVVDELNEFNKLLEIANLHVGYRVRDEIAIYMTHNSELGLLSYEDAFDYQLMQKILPRIQGSTQSVRKLLVELLFLTAKVDLRNANDDIIHRLDTELSKEPRPYPRSARKVATMLRRFEEDGFTSYWI